MAPGGCRIRLADQACFGNRISSRCEWTVRASRPRDAVGLWRSAISAARCGLAAEHPIGIAGVSQDEGDQPRWADEQESEAPVGCDRLPYRHPARHDERIDAYRDAAIRDEEE